MVAVHINHVAVIVASVIYFVIGGLWFSQILFINQWQELVGLTEEKKQENLKKNNMGFLLGMSFVAGLIACYALACIIGAFQINSIVYGALTGFLVGFSFIFTSTGASYLFAGRPLKLALIMDKFLDSYTGQSAQELVDMAPEYRIDSIVLAFEEALYKKADKTGMDKLTIPEITILAVEAMEREVNNGGWEQFFINSSRKYTQYLHDALLRIDCPKTARIAAEALEALGIQGEITEEAIDSAIGSDDEDIADRLSELDSRYYSNDESVADNLFEYIKNNITEIKLS